MKNIMTMLQALTVMPLMTIISKPTPSQGYFDQLDLDKEMALAEYELIQQKKSKLPAVKRAAITRMIEGDKL